MIRTFALALALSCLATSAWAQAQPVPETAAATVAVTKPAVKKQAPKTKTAMKPPGPAENGRCRLGVIPALGDQFGDQGHDTGTGRKNEKEPCRGKTQPGSFPDGPDG